MTGVILLAGSGKRLGNNLPKCLNIIANKTILERQLNALGELGVEKVICVVGYKKDVIREAVEHLWEKEVRFVENSKYETTNTNYSLYLALKHINDDFIFMNGDVIFRKDLLACLTKNDGDGILGIIKKSCGAEEVKVILQDEKIIDIGKKLLPQQCFGEFIGVALFRKSMRNLFFKTLHEMNEKEGLVNEYFEASLARITDKAYLRGLDITDIPCIEIDFPEDLEWANKNSFSFD